MRRQVAACLLGFLWLALAGCSAGVIEHESTAISVDGGPGRDAAPRADARPSGPCTSANCSGCCSGSTCNPGNRPEACGSAGASCKTCESGDSCTGGTCMAAADPCNGVSTSGRCASSTRVEVCLAPTGNGTPTLSSYDCATGQSCQVTNGVAGCVLTADCVDGAVECKNGSTLRRCQDGVWVDMACGGSCVHSALGDVCQDSTGAQQLSGTVVYDSRPPNSDKTDWGESFEAPAQGFLVASVRMGSTTQYFDTQVATATQASHGEFTVKIPSTVTANDYIIVFAAGTRPDGSMSFVVANPGLSAAGSPYTQPQVGSPSVWSWRWRTDSLQNGAKLHIVEDKGSGAARVFDYLRYVYALGAFRWPGTPAHPLIVWVGIGVGWDCGACQVGLPAYYFGTQFSAQIFIAGDDGDDGYWADAVTAHELGHWIMATFGRSVGEGGRHCFGVPSAPGLAWSEGWATWFSSDARDNPVYVDKQGGTMYWLDMSSRDTSGSAWPRPDASDGLLQDTYENEVTAMMWQLSKVKGLGNEPIDAALASDRMTVPPFERGYTRETWTVGEHCVRQNIRDTGQSTTFFGDFLDALRCGGTSATVIDAVTDPDSYYPYPSGSPRCR